MATALFLLCLGGLVVWLSLSDSLRSQGQPLAVNMERSEATREHTEANHPAPLPSGGFSATQQVTKLAPVPQSSAGALISLPQSGDQRTLADLLGPGTDLSRPEIRERITLQYAGIETRRKAAAQRWAADQGLRGKVFLPDGNVMELMDFSEGQPVYFITQNASAAISTGANLLASAPYSLDGLNWTVGVWDGGAVRATHLEFGGRVTVKDGSSPIDHSTHVGGTIAASGASPSAKGMASSVKIDSYEWTNDKSELTSRGATYPGEAGMIYLSNHSYGQTSGWAYTGSLSPMWTWYGNGTSSTGVESDFGKYDTYARDSDSLAYGAPYLLMFRAAGNDRVDNPSSGQSVALSPSAITTVSYDPATHPPGDNYYRNGFDTIASDAVAKNVITIGAVGDAVNGGSRSLAGAYMTSFSSWGPTDDGRIKPDVVGNGDSLFSCYGGSDGAYGYFSGTSMATPNSTGSAALLVQLVDRLFPGHAFRASTLKALLIHTADDLGTSGPDYQNGWGLVNVKAAADLVSDFHAHPETGRIAEGRVTSTVSSTTQILVWDGVSPIRATLCWTDPASTATSTGDLRTSRLVNDLDLKVIDPQGTVHQPFVMPFVGDWTSAAFSAAATKGRNATDNVEQVLLTVPSLPGAYSVVVSSTGTLTNSAQTYSLILSGGAIPNSSPAPTITAINPASASTGSLVTTLSGSEFQFGSTVRLVKSGQPDISFTGVESLINSVKCRLNVTGAAAGFWDVVVTNPDGQSATLPGGFTIVGPLWTEDFESGAVGWTHSATQGSTYWSLPTNRSHTPSHSYFASGPASANIDDLYSPLITVPAGAINLQLTFWHSHTFQSNRNDGGVLELSVDGGSWLDVTAATSGASFAAGGYTNTLRNSNALGARAAWVGTLSAFSQVIINLTDTAKYAGHSLRLRWRLGTNTSTSSQGWYIDDVALTGGIPPANLPPTITTTATANPTAVSGTTTLVQVGATDDAGEPGLIYQWATTGASPAEVLFSDNGTNTAKQTMVTFEKAGTYSLEVTVRDTENLAVASVVEVAVVQTPTLVSVTPTELTLNKGASQTFAAEVRDQFGEPISGPSVVTWTSSGGGTIDQTTGEYLASTVGGPYFVTAAVGSATGTAQLTVIGESLTHWQSIQFTPDEVAAGLADPVADPDHDGLTNLTEYALGLPPTTPSQPIAYTPALVSGQQTLTLSRPAVLPNVECIVESSPDYQTWTPLPAPEIITQGDPQTVKYTDTVPESARKYLRLRIVQKN